MALQIDDSGTEGNFIDTEKWGFHSVNLQLYKLITVDRTFLHRN